MPLGKLDQHIVVGADSELRLFQRLPQPLHTAGFFLVENFVNRVIVNGIEESRPVQILFGFDEAVKMFRFENDYDFFYFYLAWEELSRRNPRECSRYASIYMKRYNEGSFLVKANWFGKTKGIVPKIDF